jgi:hypothetical protein
MELSESTAILGERGRPARSVWRPAEHIPASAFCRRSPPIHRSEKESLEANQPGSAARDAPRGDRDGRAPPSVVVLGLEPLKTAKNRLRLRKILAQILLVLSWLTLMR